MTRSRLGSEHNRLTYSGSQLLEMIANLSTTHAEAVAKVRDDPTTPVSPEMFTTLASLFPGDPLVAETATYFSQAQITQAAKVELVKETDLMSDITFNFEEFAEDEAVGIFIDRVQLMSNADAELSSRLDILREAPAAHRDLFTKGNIDYDLSEFSDELTASVLTLRKKPTENIHRTAGKAGDPARSVNIESLLEQVGRTIDYCDTHEVAVPDSVERLRETLLEQQDLKTGKMNSLARTFTRKRKSATHQDISDLVENAAQEIDKLGASMKREAQAKLESIEKSYMEVKESLTARYDALAEEYTKNAAITRDNAARLTELAGSRTVEKKVTRREAHEEPIYNEAIDKVPLGLLDAIITAIKNIVRSILGQKPLETYKEVTIKIDTGHTRTKYTTVEEMKEFKLSDNLSAASAYAESGEKLSRVIEAGRNSAAIPNEVVQLIITADHVNNREFKNVQDMMRETALMFEDLSIAIDALPTAKGLPPESAEAVICCTETIREILGSGHADKFSSMRGAQQDGTPLREAMLHSLDEIGEREGVVATTDVVLDMDDEVAQIRAKLSDHGVAGSTAAAGAKRSTTAKSEERVAAEEANKSALH